MKVLSSTKRRWLWVALFFLTASLLVTLVVGWNVSLYNDYRRMLEVAKNLTGGKALYAPRLTIALGWIGYGAALATLILFFLRLLGEMKLNQLQSEFLATVSHELKTPIATLSLSSNLLQKGDLSREESEKLWKSHDAELERLRTEVEELLAAARWQSGPKLEGKKPLRIEEWIQASLDRWKNILGPGAVLERKGDALPGVALLDLKTLNVISDNLIDNARKFSGGPPRVTLLTERVAPKSPWASPKWRIKIQDEGWGFDPEDSKRIFRRFFRVRTLPHPVPGTGLGLYLAVSASKALGISLKGESPGKGRGAVFTMEGPELR